MITKIILCPSLRCAFYEWNRLANAYPDMWVDICRKPMSLTSKLDIKYIFCSDQEPNKLKGLHADFISIDEVFINKEEEEQNAGTN